MTTTLDALLARARAEHDRASSRSNELPEALSASAVRALEEARSARAAGDAQGETVALASLAHQISDAWPQASESGADILAYVQGSCSARAERRRWPPNGHDAPRLP